MELSTQYRSTQHINRELFQMHSLFKTVLLAIFYCTMYANSNLYAQHQPTGNMDAMFGPATAVNQGVGMTDEIRQALKPGKNHQLLSKLVGQWSVSGVAGRNSNPVKQTAEVTELLDGAWFEMRVFSDNVLQRIIHFGYDGYRKSFAMWEIGLGFTSPQSRAGSLSENNNELQFRRSYTIRRQNQPTTITEQLVISLLTADSFSWESHETIGDQAPRLQKSVTFNRLITDAR